MGCGDIASFLTRLAPALGKNNQIKRCYLFSTRLHPHYANPYSSVDPSFTLIFKWLVTRLTLITHTRFGRTIGVPVMAVCWLLLRLIIVFWAIFKIDAFLFVSGKSLLPYGLDARLFRLMGKRVVHIYLGTSSRPRFMSARWEKGFDTPEAMHWINKLRKRIGRQVKRLQHNGRCADVVIDNPLCGHYHAADFVDWFHIGFPGQHVKESVAAPAAHSTSASVRILHCPSVPEIKGSFEIEAVINELKNEGHSIEFIQLTGVPRTRVLEEISRCNFVIDQLYSDSPLAGFASEAAERGRMAVVGGYGWQALKKWMPEGMPVNGLCDPVNLKSLLKELLSNRDMLQDYGKEALEFVNGYWGEDQVATRLVKVLQGDIPPDWFCNPAELGYFLGLGADKEHRVRVIKSLINQYGVGALGPVSDELVQAVNAQMCRK